MYEYEQYELAPSRLNVLNVLGILLGVRTDSTDTRDQTDATDAIDPTDSTGDSAGQQQQPFGLSGFKDLEAVWESRERACREQRAGGGRDDVRGEDEDKRRLVLRVAEKDCMHSGDTWIRLQVLLIDCTINRLYY
jgi:hypothetical protein